MKSIYGIANADQIDQSSWPAVGGRFGKFNTVQDLIDWCDSTGGNSLYTFIIDAHGLVFRFEKEEDAVLFTLRWRT